MTIDNTPANAVPVREQNRDANGNIKVHEQGTANVSVTNSSLSVAPQAATKEAILLLGAATGDTFEEALPSGPIDASLITFTRMTGDGFAVALHGGVEVLRFDTGGGNIVLPLTQPLTVDKVRVECTFATACAARFNVVGR